jgi:hypothetical protein
MVVHKSHIGHLNKISLYRWDPAEWLEHLTANAEVDKSPGFDPSILWHSGIWGAADEAVLKQYIEKRNFFVKWSKEVFQVIFGRKRRRKGNWWKYLIN